MYGYFIPMCCKHMENANRLAASIGVNSLKKLSNVMTMLQLLLLLLMMMMTTTTTMMMM